MEQRSPPTLHIGEKQERPPWGLEESVMELETAILHAILNACTAQHREFGMHAILNARTDQRAEIAL